MSVITASPLQKRSAWEIQRAVIFALVLREFRTRIGRHWTGVVWTFLEPLGQVLLIVTVFGYLRRITSPNMEFPVFLVSGMLPYFLFRSLAQRLAESISTNRGLFSYRQVKPFDAVLGRGIVEILLWLAVVVMTLALLEWVGYQAIPQRPLEFLAVSALCALIGGGLGLLTAVSTNDQPRVRAALRMVYFPLYLASGVIFPVNKLPSQYMEWLLWNPMLQLVDLSRSSFEPRHPAIPDANWAYPAAFALIVCALAMALYRRDRQKLLTGPST
jgi:capsular polysaccharide transport system permease protein